MVGKSSHHTRLVWLCEFPQKFSSTSYQIVLRQRGLVCFRKFNYATNARLKGALINVAHRSVSMKISTIRVCDAIRPLFRVFFPRFANTIRYDEIKTNRCTRTYVCNEIRRHCKNGTRVRSNIYVCGHNSTNERGKLALNAIIRVGSKVLYEKGVCVWRGTAWFNARYFYYPLWFLHVAMLVCCGKRSFEWKFYMFSVLKVRT